MALTKVSTDGVKDQAIDLTKLLHGTSSNDGKFLRANNGADPTFETVNINLVADTSPQLGGQLDTNNYGIKFGDNDKIILGDGSEYEIYNDSSNLIIDHKTDNLTTYFGHKAGGQSIFYATDIGNQVAAKFKYSSDNEPISSVELYFANSKKFETTSGGVTVTGSVSMGSGDILGSGNLDLEDNGKIKLGTGDDLQIYHENTGNTYIQNATGNLRIDADALRLRSYTTGEDYLKADANGAVELYYDDSKKFETSSTGTITTGKAKVNGGTTTRCVDSVNTHTSGGELASFQNEATDHYGGLVVSGGEIDRECRMEAAWGQSFFTWWTDNAERMRMDRFGTVFIGKTSQSSGTAGVELYDDGPNFMTRNASGGSVLGLNDQNSTTGDALKIYYSDVLRGSLVYNGSSFFAYTASDYRLKENDTPISDGITRVKQLRPIKYNWKTDATKTYDGFIAHEVQAVVPDCVVGEKDAEVDSHGEGYQRLAVAGLVPVLTAALKDAITKIETLETKVAALEAA